MTAPLNASVEQQESLGVLASATGAPEPKFTQTAADLTAALEEITTPESPDASEVDLPSPPAAKPRPGRHSST